VSLLVIATIVTLVFNADALQVGRALWNDDAVRAAVVGQAQSSVETGQGRGTRPKASRSPQKDLAQEVADVRSPELPLGWSTDPDDPRWFDSAAGGFGKVVGLFAMILALMLGAPFGFDLLGRVSRVRVTGKFVRAGAF